MGLFYQQFECSVILDGNLSDFFSVESGVQQKCVVSRILFVVASLIGSCVGQWLIEPEASSGHSFPSLKISTLQMTLLLSSQLVASYGRRPRGSAGV